MFKFRRVIIISNVYFIVALCNFTFIYSNFRTFSLQYTNVNIYTFKYVHWQTCVFQHLHCIISNSKPYNCQLRIINFDTVQIRFLVCSAFQGVVWLSSERAGLASTLFEIDSRLGNSFFLILNMLFV